MRSLLLILISSLALGNVPAQPWDHVFENIDTTNTIRLTSPEWNNTLIKNCTIHDTGNGNDGIFLRDVRNVRIENCTIYNIDGQGGIRLSISGNGTDSVVIIQNTIFDVQENGINAPQRSQNSPPLNQDHLQIIGNTIYNTGLGADNGLHHAIYCQAADFLIKDNTIFGIRDGNGISVRSSGIISGNVVSGSSKAEKSCIRYFSDHMTGNSDSLLIENNILWNNVPNGHVLDIFDHAPLYTNSNGDSHVVKRFNIRFNTAVSLVTDAFALRISDDYESPTYTLRADGNLLVNTATLANCASVPGSIQAHANLLKDNLDHFASQTTPYDFHLNTMHQAVNFVGDSTANFPLVDIDGDMRNPAELDAGADELVISTGIAPRNIGEQFEVFPNPVGKDAQLTIQSLSHIHTIQIL
ncbi:MAG: right-handed parallel beta-helix repeat-containing protein, partial [Bacteroidota bacterium]